MPKKRKERKGEGLPGRRNCRCKGLACPTAGAETQLMWEKQQAGALGGGIQPGREGPECWAQGTGLRLLPKRPSLRAPEMASLLSTVAQTVKNPPAMQETQGGSLGREDPLEKGMAPHSSILAWRSPWTEEFGGLQSMGSQRAGRD